MRGRRLVAMFGAAKRVFDSLRRSAEGWHPIAGRAETIMKVIAGFRAVSVFDISQTDGRDLPVPVSLLRGMGGADLFNRLIGLASNMGYSVELAEFSDGRNGDCVFAKRRIRIRSDNDASQRAKTLVHEIAHATLHTDTRSRALAELEAEIGGIRCLLERWDPSDDYTFGYVASWAGGAEEAISAIKASGVRIQ